MNENEAIRILFEGVIPERIEETMGLVKKYSAQFRRVGDKCGFNLDAGGFGAIQFTQRSLEQIWLFGYAGMLALHCYSGLLHIAKCRNIVFNLDEVDQLSDQKTENERFTKIMSAIESLSSVDSEHDFTWPDDVPSPENGKPKNIELAAVFDLTLMATAYVFLHELKHVIFAAENNAPQERVNEELACDEFAAEMMLGNIAVYAESSGYPEDKVRMKRSVSIALASAFLLIATPRKNLSGTETHPPVHSRWATTLAAIDLPEDDYFWLYFSSLAIATMRHRCIKLSPVPVETFKNFSLSVVKALENSI